MPTLLELQQAIGRSLILHEDWLAEEMLADHVSTDRLDVYRNTIISGLTRALRLSYPIVERLVGAEFFEGTAQIFIQEHLPQKAYLDLYGEEFAEFLRQFQPAASLVYLSDVARLEWAVNCAIHAADIEPFELAKLAAVAPADRESVRFVAHPSIRLLSVNYPVDLIWRAICTRDDTELAKIDIHAAPINLLVERRTSGVEVVRLSHNAWRFLKALCDGEPIQSAIKKAGELEVSAALAEHLVAGRFTALDLVCKQEFERASA